MSYPLLAALRQHYNRETRDLGRAPRLMLLGPHLYSEFLVEMGQLPIEGVQGYYFKGALVKMSHEPGVQFIYDE